MVRGQQHERPTTGDADVAALGAWLRLPAELRGDDVPAPTPATLEAWLARADADELRAALLRVLVELARRG